MLAKLVRMSRLVRAFIFLPHAYTTAGANVGSPIHLPSRRGGLEDERGSRGRRRRGGNLCKSKPFATTGP